MNTIRLECQVCCVVAEIEGYDPAPSELLIRVFSEAHQHSPEDWIQLRKETHEHYMEARGEADDE